MTQICTLFGCDLSLPPPALTLYNFPVSESFQPGVQMSKDEYAQEHEPRHTTTPMPASPNRCKSQTVSPPATLLPLLDAAPIVTQQQQPPPRHSYSPPAPGASAWRPRAAFRVKPNAHGHAGASGREYEEEENTANLDPIASKRRRNTLAARKTRQRKADYLQALEEQVEMLSTEATMWRERALLAQKLLRGRGIDFNFDDEEQLAGR
ncbi:hypothetical protein K438DRAFT_2007476 [Mycena galopus ATCC 62051]|nr:hypothetical protein K438DRAFT_2007476 [Mycena galopus ATCC 62051]